MSCPGNDAASSKKQQQQQASHKLKFKSKPSSQDQPQSPSQKQHLDKQHSLVGCQTSKGSNVRKLLSFSSGSSASSSSLDKHQTSSSSRTIQQQHQHQASDYAIWGADLSQQQATIPQQAHPQQQPYSSSTGSSSSSGLRSTLLVNLATIDNALFRDQQQQLRAEQQLYNQQVQQQKQLQLQQIQYQQQLPVPGRPASGSPTVSNSSTECLLQLEAPAQVSSSSTSPSTGSTASGSHGCLLTQQTTSGCFVADLASSVASSSATNLGWRARQQQQYQHQQQASQHQQQAAHSNQPAGASASSAATAFVMSRSDTNDDVQSLGSQLNLSMSLLGASASASSSQTSSSDTTFVPGHGHHFTKKTFHKPTYCHHCGDMLWGLIGQGYICDVCNFVVHERCMKTVVSCCSTVASSVIVNPMPHCWAESHAKRKFCNVCRKRIVDEQTGAIRCTVCEYCVHIECQEFSISDCRECATYVPDQKLSDVNQKHHWREGNLPQTGSKCNSCKKSCFSAECLTGMRCEWCQLTVHASCLKNASKTCNLGCLASIMLPPYCVSIPRTDVPMETIIGIQSRFGNLAQQQAQNQSSSSFNYASSSSSMMSNMITMNAGSNLCPMALPATYQQQLQHQYHQQHQQSLGQTSGDASGQPGVARRQQAELQRLCGQANDDGSSQVGSPAPHLSQQSPQQSQTQSQQVQNPQQQPQLIQQQLQQLQLQHQMQQIQHMQQMQMQLQLQMQEDMMPRDKDEEMLRVYDGNGSLKKRSFRLVTVHKGVSRELLIAACLRAFYIHDNINHYCLIDISEPNSERELDEPNPLQPPSQAQLQQQQQVQQQQQQLSGSSIANQTQASTSSSSASTGSSGQTSNPNKVTTLMLRYRPPDPSRGTIKVYPGRLNVSNLTYCEVAVTNDTGVSDIMAVVLEEFKLDTRDMSRYRLVEVSLDKGSSVHERTMDNQECPWEIIKNVARESVRQKENTRFYLQQQDEVYCSSVAIYVGNLPTNLSQKQYESMLIEHLGKPYRFKRINPIYYEYGSCIITYDNADIAVKAFYMLRETTIRLGEDSRNLVVLLLPNIVPDMIPEGVRPLLVFVNVKSGGCQGLDLITSFRRLLNPYQVYDLENGGPLPGLYVFRKIRDYKILVSGGDGSVGWVLQCLDNVGQDSECQSPPCAIIPLGTGNDLARVLRWGSGYTGAEDPMNFLKDIIDAEEVILDRWTVVFHSDEANKQDLPLSLSITPGAGSGAEDNAAIFVMNNYLGIGLDADLCLGFHNAREENPDKFNSRLHNKGVYVKQAIRKMVNRSSWNNLNKALKLEVDGKPIMLPHVEGLIILNILSWGSGANPWGPEHEDRFVKPTHYDGMLEVVGVTGIVHMGQIQSGLSRAIRIAQGGRIKIRLTTEMPIQVDGEPWIQPACEMNIIRSALKATMLRKIKMKRRNTEPSINQEVEKVLATNTSGNKQDD